MSAQFPGFRFVGDRGLLVEYENCIDPDLNLHIQHMVHLCRRFLHETILEVITAYRSFLIIYDPFLTDPGELQRQVVRLSAKKDEQALPASRVIEIPVCYGGEWGPDLDSVARHHGLSTDEVIRIHSSCDYMVYMSGFTPGFPLLGGLSPKLWTPRRKTPRTSVPGGSVGIGNRQTGVYPFASPGGWQLIGRTKLRLFDPGKDPMVLYRLGDRIKFRPVKHDEEPL